MPAQQTHKGNLEGIVSPFESAHCTQKYIYKSDKNFPRFGAVAILALQAGAAPLSNSKKK